MALDDSHLAPLPPRDERPQVLIQISDCHLFDDRTLSKRGVNTYDSLHEVVAQIDADGTRPDVLLATGDISHDGGVASYAHFAELVLHAAETVRVLPGNHDTTAFSDQLGAWTAAVTDIGAHWRLVALDTTVPGKFHGHLNGRQFALLDEAVASAGARHIVIAMHHNPVLDQSHSPDPNMLDNARILLQHLTAWRQVRVLLWGHTHRAYDCRVDNMRLLSAPATGFQFRIENGKIETDPIPAGYRWLKLYNDGSIATGVKRVTRAPLHD